MTLTASLDPLRALETLSDGELLASVQRLTARSNVALAELLVHLGELEARGIHRERACASLYTYCVYELRMSEDAAYRRSKAARFVREYPELRDAIAKGELHLTGVLMIGPHLGGERHAEVLERARFRTKRELARLVAEIDPRPEVPALVEALGPVLVPRAGTHQRLVQALAGPVRHLPFGERPEDWLAGEEDGRGDAERPDDGTADAGPRAPEGCAPDTLEPPATRGWPERRLHYKVQFTASQEHVDLLEEVSDLLGHERPRPTLPDIHLRALRALARELRSRRRAAPVRPRAPRVAPERVADVAPERVADVAPERVADVAPEREQARLAGPASARRAGRHVPAAVRRGVWDRDAACCAYVDGRGERCRETGALQIHHRHAHALGGRPTLDNLELRCPAHNTLAAELDFGREYMDWMRGVSGGPVPGASDEAPGGAQGARRASRRRA